MKSDEFAALAARYAKYTESKHLTKGAGGDTLRREIEQVFAMTAQENAALLGDEELGTKADRGRKFDQNLRQLQMIKTWLEQMHEDAKPMNRDINPVFKGAGNGDTRSYGASPLVFGESDLQEMFKAGNGRQFLSKAVTVTTTPMAAIPQYASEFYPFLRDKPRLRDLIPTEDTDRPSVIYYRGLAAASAADVVAEGANKPESTPTWETVTAPVRKIAHFATVNDEVLMDFDAWRDIIGGELIAGIIDKENDNLLNGGAAPDLTGLLNTTGIQTQAFSNNIFETLLAATNKLRTGAAYTEPDVFVMNPADWVTIAMFRTGGSTTTDGPFVVNPLEAPSRTLWGVPLVLTNHIAAGTALVANLKMAAQIYVRQDVTFEVHPGGGGKAEWIANQTLVRAEERIALTAPRPKAIVSVDVAA